MKLLRMKTGRIVVAIYLWLFLDIIVSAHGEREREKDKRCLPGLGGFLTAL